MMTMVMMMVISINIIIVVVVDDDENISDFVFDHFFEHSRVIVKSIKKKKHQNE